LTTSIISGVVDPKLTTVRVPHKRMGEAAADMLLRLINKETVERQHRNSDRDHRTRNAGSANAESGCVISRACPSPQWKFLPFGSARPALLAVASSS
jgi:hypothetical protein